MITASVLGAIAVALGAFGAHGLKQYATSTQLQTFETAVKYQFYHVFALALTSIVYKLVPTSSILISGKCFIFGMVLFSGSLYLLTFLSIGGFNQFKWLGAITPFGGVLLIIGWILLAISVYRHHA